MGIDTFMRMYLFKQDLLLFFYDTKCTVPHHYWQSGVNHKSGTLRTVTEPQSNLRLYAGLKPFLAEMSPQSCYRKPQTLTYEHTQIPVTHLAKLHTYRCRHVLMYTFFFLLFFFLKDEKYWSRRCKNNEAAKRSRDARRLKENQISVRAAFLERENATLRQEVADMRKELGRCRNILNKYESHHLDQ